MTRPLVYRVSSPDYLIATVPHLLGFNPTDSVVFVFINDASSVCLTVRIDIPHDGEGARGQWPADLDEQFAVAAHGAKAVDVYLLAYTEDTQAGQGALESARVLAGAVGLGVREEIVVTGQRWFRPAAGGPGSAGSVDPRALESAARVFGQAPDCSRNDVGAQFARDEEAALRLAAVVPETFMTLPGSPEEVDEVAVRLQAGLMVGEPLDAEAAWKFLGALRAPYVRDTLIFDLVSLGVEERERALASLAYLTRVAPEGHVAPVASVAAALLFTAGDGVRIEAALTRALEDDAGYPLARLLATCFRSGLNPAVWVRQLMLCDRDSMLGKSTGLPG